MRRPPRRVERLIPLPEERGCRGRTPPWRLRSRTPCYHALLGARTMDSRRLLAGGWTLLSPRCLAGIDENRAPAPGCRASSTRPTVQPALQNTSLPPTALTSVQRPWNNPPDGGRGPDDDTGTGRPAVVFEASDATRTTLSTGRTGLPRSRIGRASGAPLSGRAQRCPSSLLGAANDAPDRFVGVRLHSGPAPHVAFRCLRRRERHRASGAVRSVTGARRA